MKVLLISPNVEMLPDPVFPIGAAYIASAVKAAGFECDCLDLCFEDDMPTAIVSALNRSKPDIVALSLRNVDNVAYPHAVSYLPFYKEIVSRIRAASRAVIVLGGSGFTLLPKEIKDYLGADFGIAGEADTTFPRLIEHLAGARRCRAIDGSGLVPAGVCAKTDLDALPLPDRQAFDSAMYLKRGGMGSLQTKRGCPFRCIYCTYPLIEGRNVRVRDPEKICDEIETLVAEGLHTLFFVDNAFNFPAVHAEAVCRGIVRRGLELKWSCYANPAFISEQMVDLMLEAGCTSLEFGTDAGCDTMLEAMGKDFNIADIQRASAICRRAGMPFCHSLLLGGPGETMQTVQKTLETIEKTQPTAAICMVGIRVFPNTALAETARSQGVVSAQTDFLRPVFYISEKMADAILPYIESYASRHPNWIFPGLHINMNQILQEKLRRFGVKGPLWEYMRLTERRSRTAAPNAEQ